MRRLDIGPYETAVAADTLPRIAVSNAIFAQGFFHTTNSLGLMTPALRWMNHDRSAFLVERPPCRVRIEFWPNASNEATKREGLSPTAVEVPLPWQVYAVLFAPGQNYTALDRLYVWARPEAIRTPDDKLFQLPLPNIYEGGQVCVGRQLPYNYKRHVTSNRKLGQFSPALAFSWIINQFWQDTFNIEIPPYGVPPEAADHATDLAKADGLGLITYLEFLATTEIADMLGWSYPDVLASTVLSDPRLAEDAKTRGLRVGQVMAALEREHADNYKTSIDLLHKVMQKAQGYAE